MILAFSIVGVLLALIPAGLFSKNLPLFLFPELELENCKEREMTSGQEADCSLPPLSKTQTPVSVLIPARDEEASIQSSLEAALRSLDVEIEVVVLDDHSADRTSSIVKQLAEKDSRVVYLQGASLPDGWNGKQFACKQLADVASHDNLVFLDADVRLQPHTLCRLLRQQQAEQLSLLSVFPHQETGTWLEKWIIPMMHFILLGFLPFDRMRASPHPAYAAGCGQLFLTSKSDYLKAGTHEAIRGSRHDGLKLPRVYRLAGLMTNVYDGTELAECRMYHSAGEVVRGVLKNATEGIANPRLIFPFSLLLIGGSVLPVVTLIVSLVEGHTLAIILSGIGVVLGHAPRAIAAVKLRQPIQGVICHAPATLVFVILQYVALLNQLRGRQVAWRGRSSS